MERCEKGYAKLKHRKRKCPKHSSRKKTAVHVKRVGGGAKREPTSLRSNL